MLDALAEGNLERYPVLFCAVQAQPQRETIAAQVPHHAALATATLVLGAKHQKLRVALRAPGFEPRGVRSVLIWPRKTILVQMMLRIEELARAKADPRMTCGLQRREPPRQIGAPALDVVNPERP